MSAAESIARADASNSNSGHSAGGMRATLRVWPALLLLALAWTAKFAPKWMPEGGMPGFILMFMGPLVAALAIGVWWLFFSRATIAERLVGAIGFVAALVLANVAADRSVRGMGLLMFGVPWAATAFVAATTMGRRSPPRLRTGLALAAVCVVACIVATLRTDGVRGDMAADIHFRWSPTAEEKFLASRASASGPSSTSDNSADGLGEAWDFSSANQWPEFRGPGRIGHAAGVQLATDWKASPPRELWRHGIGPGWSSFCVVGGRLFTQEQRGEFEAVVCYDAETGRELWSHEDRERFWETVGGAGPRATPTFHDGKLYAVGANGTVNCLDPRNGKPHWTRDLRIDSGAKPPMWGFSSSPLVLDGVAIVYAGGTGLTPDKETAKVDKGVVAYDAQTGELRWTAPSGDHGYSTPHRHTVGDRTLALILSNAGLTALAPATGDIEWEHLWKSDAYRVVQPLAVDESSFLLGTGNGIGTRRIRVAPKDGGGYEVEEQWTSRDMKPYFNDFVEHRGHLYGFDHDIFACIGLADGKRAWKKGRYGSGQVLLLPDADQLLVLSEMGEIVLLGANPQRHDELARWKVFDGKTWNHPVLVGSRLYVRNGEEAACFEMPVVADPAAQATRENGLSRLNSADSP